MIRSLVALSFAFGIAVPLSAQTDIKALLAKYREERTECEKLGEPADRMKPADAVFAKAEAAATAGNEALTAKLIREARWALPARPIGLPEHVERVIGYVRLRHSDRINSIVYSPDGSKLITASRDGTVRIWDLGNGREIMAYRGHAAPPTDEKGNVDDRSVLRIPAVAVSPDGQSIASTGSGEIHIWDPITGKLKKKLIGHAPFLIKGLAFIDNTALATGGDDKVVRIWNLETGKETVAFPPHNNRVEALAVSPNGKLVASGDANGLLAVYKTDGSDKKPVLGIQASDNNASILSILYSADGTKILTAGTDQNPRFIVAPGPTGDSLPGMGTTALRFSGHASRINSSARTNDGKLIATGSDDQTVRVWDAASGKTIRHFQGLLSKVSAVAIRPDGKQLAAGTEDGTIRIWELSASDDHRASTEATSSLWTAAFSPDGSKFATAGADRLIRLYDTASGKLEHTLTGHSAAVTGVAFPDGGRLASSSGDKLVKLWDIKAGKFIRDLVGHSSAVLAIASHGTVLVSGGIDKSVKGWDVESGKPTWSWTSRSAVAALAIRNGGKHLAIGTADGWLSILDLGSGEPKPIGNGQQAHISGVAAIAYSPDGSKLATVGGDGKFLIWSIANDGTPSIVNKDESRKPTAGTSVALSAVAFSNDGKLAASAGADMAIHIWDTNTGAELRTLRAHTDWVTTVAFQPAGDRILSVGVDRSARLFEMSKAEEASRIGHAKSARAVAVSRDGQLLISGSDDTTAKIWNVATGQELLTLSESGQAIYSVAFLDNTRVATGGDDMRFRLWSTKPPKVDRSVEMGQIYVLMASADGKRIGVWSRDQQNKDHYHILNADESKGPEPLIETERKVSCVTFSSDLAWIISGDEEGKIRIWDAEKRMPIGADWPIHDKRVVDVAVTADRKTIVAVDEDGTAKIANAEKRDVAHTVKTGISGVAGIMSAPAGNRFAVFGSEGEIKTFDSVGQELRSWRMPTGTNGVAFTLDGKKLITANADGTLAVLVLP